MSARESAAAHNLESSEGQGAHPRTPSQSDAAARPEATLPGPESDAATARHDFTPKPADPVWVKFDCGHSNAIGRDEYGDGSAWCNACGEFKVYARCLTCHSLDCQSIKGPTLAHEATA